MAVRRSSPRRPSRRRGSRSPLTMDGGFTPGRRPGGKGHAMAVSRPTWSGFIRFSLVSVPVKAFPVADSEGQAVTLNQLHRGCNARVQYKKTCPVHGEL